MNDRQNDGSGASANRQQVTHCSSAARSLSSLHRTTTLKEYDLPAIAVANLRDLRKITTLFEWQADCLALPGVLCPMGVVPRNLVYTASTSGGKSLVAEIIMLRRLNVGGAPAGKRPIVLYCQPFAVTVEQKAAELRQLLHSTKGKGRAAGNRYPIAAMHGNNDLLLGEACIAVCTYERALSLVTQVHRRYEEARSTNRLQDSSDDTLVLPDQLRCVVLDEVHLIGDKKRGTVVETLLAKLLIMSKGDSSAGVPPIAPHMQLVCLSATLPDAAALAQYTSAQLYETDYRPVKLTEYVLLGPHLFKMRVTGGQCAAAEDAQDRPGLQYMRTLLGMSPSMPPAPIVPAPGRAGHSKSAAAISAGGASLPSGSTLRSLPTGPPSASPPLHSSVAGQRVHSALAVAVPAQRPLLPGSRIDAADAHGGWYLPGRVQYEACESVLISDSIRASGQVLVFKSTVRQVVATAVRLAQVITKELPPGSNIVWPGLGPQYRPLQLEAMDQLRKPAGRDAQASPHMPDLIRCIGQGVAFHHAQLADHEKQVVERLFKLKALAVLVSTSTLAAGVNLPASLVLIDPLVGTEPLDTVRYKQMAGRAGRTGHAEGGESILMLPCSPYTSGYSQSAVTATAALQSCLTMAMAQPKPAWPHLLDPFITTAATAVPTRLAVEAAGPSGARSVPSGPPSSAPSISHAVVASKTDSWARGFYTEFAHFFLDGLLSVRALPVSAGPHQSAGLQHASCTVGCLYALCRHTWTGYHALAGSRVPFEGAGAASSPMQLNTGMLQLLVSDCLVDLRQRGFVQFTDSQPRPLHEAGVSTGYLHSSTLLLPTHLATAAGAAGLSPHEALAKLALIHAATRSFILEDDVHTLYLSVAVRHGGKVGREYVRWLPVLLHVLSGRSDRRTAALMRLAERQGVTSLNLPAIQALLKRLSNGSGTSGEPGSDITYASISPVSVPLPFSYQVNGQLYKLEPEQYEVWCGVAQCAVLLPLLSGYTIEDRVATLQGIPGMQGVDTDALVELKDATIKSARGLAIFCNSLSGLHMRPLVRLLVRLRDSLGRKVKREYSALLDVPGVGHERRAAALVAAGISSVRLLASCTPDEVYDVFMEGTPFVQCPDMKQAALVRALQQQEERQRASTAVRAARQAVQPVVVASVSKSTAAGTNQGQQPALGDGVAAANTAAGGQRPAAIAENLAVASASAITFGQQAHMRGLTMPLRDKQRVGHAAAAAEAVHTKDGNKDSALAAAVASSAAAQVLALQQGVDVARISENAAAMQKLVVKAAQHWLEGDGGDEYELGLGDGEDGNGSDGTSESSVVAPDDDWSGDDSSPCASLSASAGVDVEIDLYLALDGTGAGGDACRTGQGLPAHAHGKDSTPSAEMDSLQLQQKLDQNMKQVLDLHDSSSLLLPPHAQAKGQAERGARRKRKADSGDVEGRDDRKDGPAASMLPPQGEETKGGKTKRVRISSSPVAGARGAGGGVATEGGSAEAQRQSLGSIPRLNAEVVDHDDSLRLLQAVGDVYNGLMTSPCDAVLAPLTTASSAASMRDAAGLHAAPPQGSLHRSFTDRAADRSWASLSGQAHPMRPEAVVCATTFRPAPWRPLAIEYRTSIARDMSSLFVHELPMVQQHGAAAAHLASASYDVERGKAPTPAHTPVLLFMHTGPGGSEEEATVVRATPGKPFVACTLAQLRAQFAASVQGAAAPRLAIDGSDSSSWPTLEGGARSTGRSSDGAADLQVLPALPANTSEQLSSEYTTARQPRVAKRKRDSGTSQTSADMKLPGPFVADNSGVSGGSEAPTPIAVVHSVGRRTSSRFGRPSLPNGMLIATLHRPKQRVATSPLSTARPAAIAATTADAPVPDARSTDQPPLIDARLQLDTRDAPSSVASLQPQGDQPQASFSHGYSFAIDSPFQRVMKLISEVSAFSMCDSWSPAPPWPHMQGPLGQALCEGAIVHQVSDSDGLWKHIVDTATPSSAAVPTSAASTRPDLVSSAVHQSHTRGGAGGVHGVLSSSSASRPPVLTGLCFAWGAGHARRFYIPLPPPVLLHSLSGSGRTDVDGGSSLQVVAAALVKEQELGGPGLACSTSAVPPETTACSGASLPPLPLRAMALVAHCLGFGRADVAVANGNAELQRGTAEIQGGAPVPDSMHVQSQTAAAQVRPRSNVIFCPVATVDRRWAAACRLAWNGVVAGRWNALTSFLCGQGKAADVGEHAPRIPLLVALNCKGLLRLLHDYGLHPPCHAGAQSGTPFAPTRTLSVELADPAVAHWLLNPDDIMCMQDKPEGVDKEREDRRVEGEIMQCGRSSSVSLHKLARRYVTREALLAAREAYGHVVQAITAARRTSGHARRLDAYLVLDPGIDSDVAARGAGGVDSDSAAGVNTALVEALVAYVDPPMSSGWHSGDSPRIAAKKRACVTWILQCILGCELRKERLDVPYRLVEMPMSAILAACEGRGIGIREVFVHSAVRVAEEKRKVLRAALEDELVQPSDPPSAGEIGGALKEYALKVYMDQVKLLPPGATPIETKSVVQALLYDGLGMSRMCTVLAPVMRAIRDKTVHLPSDGTRPAVPLPIELSERIFADWRERKITQDALHAMCALSSWPSLPLLPLISLPSSENGPEQAQAHREHMQSAVSRLHNIGKVAKIVLEHRRMMMFVQKQAKPLLDDIAVGGSAAMACTSLCRGGHHFRASTARRALDQRIYGSTRVRGTIDGMSQNGRVYWTEPNLQTLQKGLEFQPVARMSLHEELQARDVKVHAASTEGGGSGAYVFYARDGHRAVDLPLSEVITQPFHARCVVLDPARSNGTRVHTRHARLKAVLDGTTIWDAVHKGSAEMHESPGYEFEPLLSTSLSRSHSSSRPVVGMMDGGHDSLGDQGTIARYWREHGFPYDLESDRRIGVALVELVDDEDRESAVSTEAEEEGPIVLVPTDKIFRLTAMTYLAPEHHTAAPCQKPLFPWSTPTRLALRDSIVAAPGCVLVSFDYRQVEVRVLAYLTQSQALNEVLQDPHAEIFRKMASIFLDKPVEAVSDGERAQLKQIVYSIMYGAGANSLASALNVPPGVAVQKLRLFDQKFRAVHEFRRAVMSRLRENGYVETLLGRRRFIHVPTDPQDRGGWEAAMRKAVNCVCQASAADIIKLAMQNIAADSPLHEEVLAPCVPVDHAHAHAEMEAVVGPTGLPASSLHAPAARLVLQIHDELLFEVRVDSSTRTAVRRAVRAGGFEDASAAEGGSLLHPLGRFMQLVVQQMEKVIVPVLPSSGPGHGSSGAGMAVGAPVGERYLGQGRAYPLNLQVKTQLGLNWGDMVEYSLGASLLG